MKEIIQDQRLLKLAPSDRWYYVAYLEQLEEIQERGPLAALELSPEEYSRWRDRLIAAGLFPRSFA